jgi:hypothetical protein
MAMRALAHLALFLAWVFTRAAEGLLILSVKISPPQAGA